MKQSKLSISDSVKAALITAALAIGGFGLFAAYEVFVAIETPGITKGWIERWIKETDSNIQRLEGLHMKPCSKECKECK